MSINELLSIVKPGEEETEPLTDDQHTLKRPRKCPGCKLLHAEHSFGDPGPYCTGPDDTHLSDDGIPPPDEENDLLEQVKHLKLTEEALAKKSRIKKLKLEVAERQRRIEQLTKLQGTTTGDFSLSAEHLKAKKPAAVVGFPSTSTEHTGPNSSKDHGASPTPHGHDVKTPSVTTPLDFLLAGYAGNRSSDQQSQQIPAQQMHLTGVLNPDGPLSGPLASQESSMFLKPAQLAKGERVLRIVDFVDKIVTNTEDRTISDLGNTKLVISSGPKKPKLESLSIAQWVVGNTRIFHSLLSSGKLPFAQDVQHYLAYTVKIMELSSKFSWPSLLQYDDKFRHIQAVYNYPWSFDSHHLHTVILEPKRYAGGKSTSGSAPANFSPDGRVICRNFNRVKGCSLADCHFAHVCNRQVNGRACGLAHPSHSHPGVRGSVQGQGSSATSS